MSYGFCEGVDSQLAKMPAVEQMVSLDLSLFQWVLRGLEPQQPSGEPVCCRLCGSAGPAGAVGAAYGRAAGLVLLSEAQLCTCQDLPSQLQLFYTSDKKRFNPGF